MLFIIYLLEDEHELSLGMLIRPKRIYNFCLLHACFGLYCYVVATLLYIFITYFGTNLLMVAKVHKFLFLYFVCRNYLHKGKKLKKEPCRSWTLRACSLALH